LSFDLDFSREPSRIPNIQGISPFLKDIKFYAMISRIYAESYAATDGRFPNLQIVFLF